MCRKGSFIRAALLLFCFCLQGTIALAQTYPSINAQGWSDPLPHPTLTRTIYVSSSQGDDSNDGLSALHPKRTLGAGFQLLRDGYPDWLRIKAGDEWNERLPNWNLSGYSEQYPMVFTSYGTGARPKLNRDGEVIYSVASVQTSPGVHAPAPRAHLAIIGLQFEQPISALNPVASIELFDYWSDVLIEDCFFQHTSIVMHTIDIIEARLSNIRLRRNEIVGAWSPIRSTGLFWGHVDNWLLEENIFDQNGAGPATAQSHHVYVHESCGPGVARGNIASRGNVGGDGGFQIRPGGLVEDNALLRNSSSLLVGESIDTPAPSTVRNNLVLEGVDISPSNPLGWGIAVDASGMVEGNIVAHDTGSTGNVTAYPMGGKGTLTFQNNISYAWGGNAVNWSGTSPTADIYFVNNDIEQTSGGTIIQHDATAIPVLPRFHYSGNHYFSTSPNYFWFGVYPSYLTSGDWSTATGENNLTLTAKNYRCPNRTASTYMAFLGYPANMQSLDSFIDLALLRRRGSENVALSARSLYEFVKDGFQEGGTCEDVDPPPTITPTPSATPTPIATGTETPTPSPTPTASPEPVTSPGATPTPFVGSSSNLARVGVSAVVRSTIENSRVLGLLRFTRTGSMVRALRVYFTVSGSATRAADYKALGKSIKIPAGRSSASLNVRAFADHIIEGKEKVRLTITENAAYRIASGHDSATISIRDADQ